MDDDYAGYVIGFLFIFAIVITIVTVNSVKKDIKREADFTKLCVSKGGVVIDQYRADSLCWSNKIKGYIQVD